VIRYGRKPRWKPLDRALAVALTLYEDGLCRCGQPRDRAHNPANADHYEVDSTTCYACDAVHDYRQEKGSDLGHADYVGVWPDPDMRLR